MMKSDAELTMVCRHKVADALRDEIERLRMYGLDKSHVDYQDAMLAALDDARWFIGAWERKRLIEPVFALDSLVWVITDDCEKGFTGEREAICNRCRYGRYHAVQRPYGVCVMNGIPPEFIFKDYESCRKRLSEWDGRILVRRDIPLTCPARRLYEKEV